LGYFLLSILLFPLGFLLSLWGRVTNPPRKLLIATGKIGDYLNYTPTFSLLEKFDILIDKPPLQLAEKEHRIEEIFLQPEVKGGLNKFLFPLKLASRGYREVYVLTPNAFNLMVGGVVKGARKRTLFHYNQRWFEKFLIKIGGFEIVPHSRNDLTIATYLKVVGGDEMGEKGEVIQKFWKSLPLPNPLPNFSGGGRFKVGFSLSAGNRMKTISEETWGKIIDILEKFPVEYHIFGVTGDEVYLSPFRNRKLKNPLHLWIGKIPLGELPGYISQLNLFISSDTGTAYIADTFRVPILLFAGPCHMEEQKPLGEKVLIVKSNAPCAPFSFIFSAPYKALCGELYKITPAQEEEIYNFVKQLYHQWLLERRKEKGK